MKFIFPQNYNFNSKLLGLIDYVSALIDLIWGGIIFIILNLLFKSLQIKIFIFIILFLPIFIISIVGINGENMLHVIIYFFKFVLKNKIYIYNKSYYLKHSGSVAPRVLSKL